MRFLAVLLATSVLGTAETVTLHAGTDAPEYIPGATVQLRALAYGSQSRLPVAAHGRALLTIAGPDGRTSVTRSLLAADGIFGAAWTLPTDAPAGTWTLSLREPGRSAPSERRFQVAADAPRRHLLEMQFDRDGLGPGDIVSASLRLRGLDGSAIRDMVQVSIRQGGRELAHSSLTLNENGSGQLLCPLPPDLDLDGDALLALTFTDAGQTTTLLHSLPLAGRGLRLAAYPEGGELVLGLACRVYLEARLPDGGPAAIPVSIVNDAGTVLATITTGNDGRGWAELVPHGPLRLRSDAQTRTVQELPEPRATGLTLRAEHAAPGEAVPLVLCATTTGPVEVALHRRGQVLARQRVDLTAGTPQRIELLPTEPSAATSAGVLVVTVGDATGRPLAERLIWRAPVQRLQVVLSPQRQEYQPGEEVICTVEIRDEQQRPTSALLGCSAVAADAWAGLAPRQHAPRLPAQVLLEHEVEELAGDCDLDDAACIDRLLATQGWRRFVDWSRTEPFLAQHGDAAARVLAQPAERPFTHALLPPDPSAPRGKLHPLAVDPDPSSLPPSPDLLRPRERNFGSAPAFSARWLVRQQAADGRWSVRPSAGTKPEADQGTWIEQDGDLACTGLSLLCFLGAGYDHRCPSAYKAPVAKGLTWLLAQMRPDGSFSDDTDVHAIVVMALGEAYSMTNDPELRTPVQEGVNILLARQVRHQGQGLGWPVCPTDWPICDTLTGVWSVMALKSASAGGMDVGHSLDWAQAWLHGAWQAAHPGHAALDAYDESTFPDRWDPRDGRCWGPELPEAGGLLAVFLGLRIGDVLLDTLANHIARHRLPLGKPCDALLCYWGTLTMFQVGGEHWQTWDSLYRQQLLDWQVGDGSLHDGSWSPHDMGPLARRGGRIITTTLCTMSLEIHYRYWQYLHANAPVTTDPTYAQSPRAYAHRHHGGDLRRDRTRTLCWQPALRAGADGRGELRFAAGDRLGPLRILVDAGDEAGRLGTAETMIRIGKPLRLNMDLPPHLNACDRCLVQVAVADDRPAAATRVTISADHCGSASPQPHAVMLSAGRGLLELPLQAAAAGELELAVSIAEGEHRDGERRRIPVLDCGWPWQAEHSGLLDAAAGETITSISIPAQLLPGSVRATLLLLPSPEAEVAAAATTLMQEPSGCCEQTASALAGLVRAAACRHTLGIADDQQQIATWIAAALHRLAGYRTADGGFSWYGTDQPSIGLTAQVLQTLAEVRERHPVPEELLTEPRAWLLAQFDADSGWWPPDPRLPQVATEPELGSAITSAIACAALLVTKPADAPPSEFVGRTLDRLTKQPASQANSVLTLLTAWALYRAGRQADACAVADRLDVQDDGSLAGATASLTGRQGEALTATATALAVRLWQGLLPQQPGYAARIQGAQGYLLLRPRQGRHVHPGLLAQVLAVVQDTSARAETRGSVRTRLDDGPEQVIAVQGPQAIQIELAAQLDCARANRLSLDLDGTGRLAWRLEMEGTSLMPLHDDNDAPLALSVALDRRVVERGDTVGLSIGIAPRGDALRDPICRIRVPAGLEILPAMLDRAVATGDLEAWQQRRDELILYAPAVSEARTLALTALARWPGDFQAGASEAWDYYQHRRAWAEGLAITIR